MIGRLRGRLTESDGFTLSEMIVVMAILGIVLAALTQLFVSASKAQVDMNNRFQAQQNGRIALDRLRQEIHCASGVVGTPTASSVTITLKSYCPTNGTGADGSFTWCTVGASAPYALWRYPGAACSGTGRKWADNLTTAAAFSPVYAAPAVGSGALGTISVDLVVDLTPSDTRQRYELKDNIVLRNTTRL
jgi:prepilin-type N-terminal cleavage/methylation domain-containing protein